MKSAYTTQRIYWLMNSFPSQEMDDQGRYAVVSFDAKWTKQLWKAETAWRTAAKRLSPITLNELTLWDSSATFFDTVEDVVDDQDGWLSRYDYIEITADDYDRLGDKVTRTECDMLHIGKDYVFWCSLSKYTNTTFETPRISLKDFECEVHGRDIRKRGTCLKCISK